MRAFNPFSRFLKPTHEHCWKPDDPLAPARGVIIGLGIGAGMWGILGLIVLIVRSW